MNTPSLNFPEIFAALLRGLPGMACKKIGLPSRFLWEKSGKKRQNEHEKSGGFTLSALLFACYQGNEDSALAALVLLLWEMPPEPRSHTALIASGWKCSRSWYLRRCYRLELLSSIE